MKFSNAAVVEQLCWQLRLADHPRSQNRAKIAELFDGFPPYTAQEERDNQISVNCNFLEATRVAHDARNSYHNAMMKPGNFFTARTDMGTAHKRSERGVIVTREVNRIMKKCPLYFENLRSKFAQLVLHGIAPSAWENRENWCPDSVGVNNVLIPANTLLSMRNLPFFAIFRSYTAMQLYEMTHGAKVDKAWNIPMADAVIKWATQQTAALMGTTWPEVWSPEAWEQRIKEDSGLYASDAIPTIDCCDFYFYDDDGKTAGWRRRMILDVFGQPGVGGAVPEKRITGVGDDFLYNPGDRVYADKIGDLIHFQFADLSAVAPFKYHAVRSLGFLMFAVCHLQNRLRCKFNEAVFENLMCLMRVRSLDEAERALKINLINRGIVDETVQFIPPTERWQVNAQLVEMGLQENARLIQENNASYSPDTNHSSDGVERTAFQVHSEIQAATALIAAALLQAYTYESFAQESIFARFCIKNSRDPDVRTFQARCLQAGVPEKMLVPEAWELEPERVMGSGMKALESQIAQTLMSWRSLYAPESQQIILRQATLAVTDDPGLTKQLVPDADDKISDAKHDAMLAMGTLMLGLPVKFTAAHNAIETVEVLMAELGLVLQRIEQRGGMAEEPELIGAQNVGQTISELIGQIAQDKNEAQRVKQYSTDLAQLMNLVTGYAQRLAEQRKKAAQQNGAAGNGEAAAKAAETQAKIEATRITAEAKAANTRESHAARTAQKQVSFELEEKRKQQAHQQQLELEAQKAQLELQKEIAQLELEGRRHLHEVAVTERASDIKTAHEVRRQKAKAKVKTKTE